MSAVTAGQLIDALRRHHEAPKSKPVGGYLATEIQAPDSERRADAIWVPINRANRGHLVGYETKVTRADIVQELRDPQKADAWERYCRRWWLVVPHASLVEGLDIPSRWGIMTPPAKTRRTMTVVRPAPELSPVDASPALGTVIAKIIYGGDRVDVKLRYAEETVERQRELLRERDERIRSLEIAAGVKSMTRWGGVTLVDVITEIERLGGYDKDQHMPGMAGRARDVTAEQVARAALGLTVSEHWADYLRSTIASALEYSTDAVTALSAAKEAADA